MNRRIPDPAGVVSAHDRELEAGVFSEDIRENRPFVTLKLIPGTTPLHRFQERCLAFAGFLSREELEVLGSVCILQRGELATPEELGAAESMTNTLAREG